MTDNEKLIEEARRAKQAVYLATDASVADDLSRIIGGLADALEAAEKAHTPTDDEREALIAAAREKAEWRWPIPINYLEGDSEHTMLVALRHAYVLGVGDATSLRRSEVPEPSAERELTPCGNLVCTGCRVCGCPALGIAPEPQGEPSDAQIEAALQALGHARSGVTTPAMRRALRAAGGVDRG